MNSQLKTEELKDETLENFKMQMALLKSNGINKYFGIYVNGFPVVTMSDNPNEIDKAVVFPETSTVRVITYKSYNGEIESQVVYQRQQVQAPIQQSGMLSGTEVDDRIRTAIDNARRKWDFDLMQKELSDTKKLLEDREAQIEEMEDLIEELQKSKGKIGSVHLGEIASVMVESFMRRNVDKISKLPGGSTLAGLLSENPPAPQSPAQESEASFESIPEGEQSWWSDVEIAFTPEEIEYIKAIVAHLVQQKDKIKTVLELLIQK